MLSEDENPNGFPYYVWSYCKLVDFFARDVDFQSASIPARCEPTYASFNEGDGSFNWPLEILFYSLYDAAANVANSQYPNRNLSSFRKS